MEEKIKKYEKYIALLEEHNELLQKTLDAKEEQIRILESIISSYEQQ